MNLEKEVSRRSVLKWTRDTAIEAALSVPIAVGISSINALIHPNNTRRALEAIFEGKEINCGHDVEPSNNLGYPYDAIVVPGAGRIQTGVNPDGKKIYIPNPDGRIRLDAAAYAYADHVAPIIIVLDGINVHEEGGVTTRNYLRNTFTNLTGDTRTIPVEAILSDKDSVNTSTNMEELSKITEDRGLLKVLVVTNDYHEQRAMQAACIRGIHANQKSAEEIIEEHDEERGKSLKAARAGTKASIKEKVELAESIIDPYGYMPTIYRLIDNERKRLQVRFGLQFR